MVNKEWKDMNNEERTLVREEVQSKRDYLYKYGPDTISPLRGRFYSSDPDHMHPESEEYMRDYQRIKHPTLRQLRWDILSGLIMAGLLLYGFFDAHHGTSDDSLSKDRSGIESIEK
jgi:hypothetical protein